MIDFTIHTCKDLEQAVETYGILPLFRNPVPGFSVEEHVAKEVWFGDAEGVWEWKGPVIRNTGCAYGKYLAGRAVFISRAWFPDFANWRRDGYDFDARFDDELASFRDKALFDLLDAQAPVLSGDLKKAGNYSKNGKAGFDTILNRLQSQCYVLTSDFVYKRDKQGRPYGWGVAQYSTPEKFMGEEFTSKVYKRKPEASYQRVFAHIQSLFPECPGKTIERLLHQGVGQERGGEIRTWLIPSNPKYYDIIAAFEAEEIIDWKQGNDNIREGDIVFMYVGAPYSAILYRCEVVETDIPYLGHSENVNLKKLMKIRRLDVYPQDKLTLKELNKYDVVTVRGPRSMPPQLIEDIAADRLR